MGLKTQDAAAVLNQLRAKTTKVVNDLYAVAGENGSQYPAPYRSTQASRSINEIERALAEAGAAIGAWASKSTQDARQRHRNGEPKGTEAETRRLRREMELQRLITTGQIRDQQAGVHVVATPFGGKVVENGSAFEYASRAEAAILGSDYEAAAVFAEASIALGGPATAQQFLATARELLETPEQQEARKDLATVSRAVLTVQRDAWSAEATAYDYAAKTAEAIGEDHRVLASKALRAGMKAKLAALGLTERDANGEVVPGSYQQLAPALPKPPERKPGPIVSGAAVSAGQE